jgi:2-polyprenyl-3-methyl-5-hydroxy-6-metoxy-1,4-benzoquinol methylase
MHPVCTLCNSNSELILSYLNRNYFRCSNCKSVFADPDNLLEYVDERNRYLEHNNDVFDPGYRDFVKPIVDLVLSKLLPDQQGLDFGAGTGPVISQMLKEKGYNIEQYDPFFCNNFELLSKKYDYIICCEVIEHFYNPRGEFAQLRSMLKPGGQLICMTDFLKDETNFQKWYYKNDPTHVFFYHQKSLDYIKEEFLFSSFTKDTRMVVFSA